MPRRSNFRQFSLRFRERFLSVIIFSGPSRPRVALHFSCATPHNSILGDPGADSGCEGKSKRAEKYGTKKKSKERRVEPLGTMSYQTSSKRSPPFWLLIGQKNTKVFWHQSEARTAATVWNWSGKTFSQGIFSPFFTFLLRAIFSRSFRLSLAPTICPWVSEDDTLRPHGII